MRDDNFKLLTVGWREWVHLPDLGINYIKAKVDTGARTSALHTFMLTPYRKNGVHRVKFMVHPFQNTNDIVKECDLEIMDQRNVTDSGGHKEERYFVQTSLFMGEQQWTIEMTLTNRDNMRFRMLLGRTAMKNRIIVDPAKSYLVEDAPSRI